MINLESLEPSGVTYTLSQFLGWDFFAASKRKRALHFGIHINTYFEKVYIFIDIHLHFLIKIQTLCVFLSYEHVGEVVVEVEKHKSCQCGCKIKEEVNILNLFFVFPLSNITNFSGKVNIFWESHKILWNLHLTFDWHYLHRPKVRWRFRKILWPSHNIWTLRCPTPQNK